LCIVKIPSCIDSSSESHLFRIRITNIYNPGFITTVDPGLVIHVMIMVDNATGLAE